MKSKAFATTLRKNMTKAETYLWQRIRRKQLNAKFRRQQKIGNYIVDFVCFENRLVIEVDGGQHCERPYDKARDEWLVKQGFRVLRLWNNDIIQNIDGVLKVIADNISPSPLSPPVKGGERCRGKLPAKKGKRGRGKPLVEKGEKKRKGSQARNSNHAR